MFLSVVQQSYLSTPRPFSGTEISIAACLFASSIAGNQGSLYVYGKGKAVPLHAMEAHGGRGGIAPTHA
jgi:uncharacterized phosphosugar-binding protein